MNQAIQFPDLEYWDEARQAVCLPVLVNGFRLECVVSGAWLRRHFDASADPLALFKQFRWDVEEVLEQHIRERADTDGCYSLS